MELKQRMTHTVEVTSGRLPPDYADAVECLKDLIDALRAAGHHEQSFEYMFLPEYIETRGLDHFELSVDAFEFVTQFTSCEFAVRPFIHRFGQTMLDCMLEWSRHPHEMVRRLASEGSRPRLPWAMALLKHASRSLLKQGDPQILALFGYDAVGIEVSGFTLETPTVAFGDVLVLRFEIENRSAQEKLIRLEYAVYHLKKNGSLAPKVFKISERELAAGARDQIERKHRIKPITTRKYYAGEHRVAVIVNGRETESIAFQLGI